MLKVGNKHAKVICDTCSKLSIETQNSVIYFHFEHLSIILTVPLLPTLSKYKISGVLSFFNTAVLLFNICNQSE